VKIVHVKDTSRLSLLSDNTKSVRSSTWDPSGKFLVIANGKLSKAEANAGTDDGFMRWQAPDLRYLWLNSGITEDHGGCHRVERVRVSLASIPVFDADVFEQLGQVMLSCVASFRSLLCCPYPDKRCVQLDWSLFPLTSV
jgi:hypothetical protein